MTALAKGAASDAEEALEPSAPRVTLQALVPGLYAWATTVAPIAWGAAGRGPTKVASSLGILALVAAPWIERRSTGLARILAGWALVGCSVLTWALGGAHALGQVDEVRGLCGMLGWGLFAVVVASPVSRSSRPRMHPGAAWVYVTVAFAVCLDLLGWGSSDRGLLVRLVALIGGLALISAGAAVAAPQSVRRSGRRRRGRFWFWVLAATLLMGAGLVRTLWR